MKFLLGGENVKPKNKLYKKKGFIIIKNFIIQK
jgi:hypothetical protein